MPVDIRVWDFRHGTEEEVAAYNRCSNRMRAERWPDDPPVPVGETAQGFKHFPNHIDMTLWTGWVEDVSRIGAYGQIEYSFEDNLHMAEFSIDVLPEFRRQGLGREFLSRIAEVAKEQNRRLLITDTTTRIPAGEAFMLRIGAEKGLEMRSSQLVIADLDPDLLHEWQERARERGVGFEIGRLEGRYPQEDMDAIVDLHALLNQQPLGDLDMEDSTYSAENIRQSEDSLFARGFERWTLFAREADTGRFAGYSEVFWNPSRPEIIYQGMTGVFPEFRNRGLGRWLKAAMLDRILAERPQARLVRTGNADANAPMLKINNELGFKPYVARAVWQVETAKVAEYLSRRR